MTDVASLAIGVDGTAIQDANKQLDEFVGKAGAAEVAAEGLTAAQIEFTTAMVNGETLTSKSNQTLLEMEAAGKQSSNTFKTLVNDVTGAANSNTKLGEEAEKAGFKIKNQGRVLQEFTFFLKDLATGNAQYATRELGSMAASSGVLALAFTGVGAAVVAVTAVIGTYAFGLANAAQSSQKINEAIISTGNYAGTTASQIEDASITIGNSTDISTGKVRQLLTELTASGKFTQDQTQKIAQIAGDMATGFGVSADKTVASFEKMSGGVVKFAIEHEKQYHDITLSELKAADTLEKHGKNTEALDIILDAIADKTHSRAKKSEDDLTDLDRGLNVAKKAWLDFWDAAFGGGRSSEAANDNIRNLAAGVKEAAAQVNGAIAQGLPKENVDNLVKSMQTQQRLMVQAIADQKKQTDAAAETGKVEQDNQKKIDEWEKTRNKKAPKGRTDKGADTFGAQTDSIQADADSTLKLAAAYDVSDAAALRLEASRAALTNITKKEHDGAVGKQYDDLLAARTTANLDLAVAKIVETSSKQTATLNFNSTAQSKLNKEVADGTISSTQAQKELAKEVALRELLAAEQAGNADAIKAATDAYNKESAAIDKNNQSALAASVIANTQTVNAQNKATQEQIALFNASSSVKERTLALDSEIAKLTAEGTSLFSAEGSAALRAATNAAALKTQLANLGTSQTSIGEGYANQITAEINFQSNRVQRYKAANDQIAALVTQGILTFSNGERAKNVLASQLLEERLSYSSQFFGKLASLSAVKNKELADIGKAAAIIQASIDTYAAINKTLAATPYPWSIPLAAAVGVEGFANVAAIAGFADGGLVSGAGSSTSDSIAARLSDGEYVVKAAAVKQVGTGFLDAVNNSENSPKFAQGGSVGSSTPSNVGNVYHFDFSNANLGGVDLDTVEARFANVMDKYYAPKITRDAVQQAYATTAKQTNRQALNKRAGGFGR